MVSSPISGRPSREPNADYRAGLPEDLSTSNRFGLQISDLHHERYSAFLQRRTAPAEASGSRPTEPKSPLDGQGASRAVSRNRSTSPLSSAPGSPRHCPGDSPPASSSCAPVTNRAPGSASPGPESAGRRMLGAVERSRVEPGSDSTRDREARSSSRAMGVPGSGRGDADRAGKNVFARGKGGGRAGKRRLQEAGPEEDVARGSRRPQRLRRTAPYSDLLDEDFDS